MRFGKKYVCEDVRGSVKILTATQDGSGNVCFTDDEEYYYFDGFEDFGDEIVRYYPYGWSESIVSKIFVWAIILILVFYAGIVCGKIL